MGVSRKTITQFVIGWAQCRIWSHSCFLDAKSIITGAGLFGCRWSRQRSSIFQVRALLAHMLAWIYHWLNHWVRMWVERRRTNALSEIRYKPKMVSFLGSYLVAIEVLFQPPLSKSLLCNGQKPAELLNFDDVAIICEQLEMSLFVLAPWHWCIALLMQLARLLLFKRTSNDNMCYWSECFFRLAINNSLRCLSKTHFARKSTTSTYNLSHNSLMTTASYLVWPEKTTPQNIWSLKLHKSEVQI